MGGICNGKHNQNYYKGKPATPMALSLCERQVHVKPLSPVGVQREHSGVKGGKIYE